MNIEKIVKKEFNNIEYIEDKYIFEDSEIDDIVYDLKISFKKEYKGENFDIYFDELFDEIKDCVIDIIEERKEKRLNYLIRKNKCCSLDEYEWWDLYELQGEYKLWN